MLSVAWCREGHKLYSFHSTPRHHYYRCQACKGKMVPAGHLHDVATRWVQRQIGRTRLLMIIRTLQRSRNQPPSEEAQVSRRL